MSVISRKVVYGVAAAVLLVVAANLIFVQRGIWEAKSKDSRNQGIDIFAYYQYGIIPSNLVIDIWSVEATKSMADVSRFLLTIAWKFKDEEFAKVYLARRGEPRFLLKGSYFSTLGREYGVQNPVYTLRTMPENVYLPDGKRAFGSWAGGLIGVIGQQMDDLNQMHRRWYADAVAQ